MNFKQWLNKNEDDLDVYNYPTESMEQAFEAGQQQYKSIVKTVDPNNLPEGLVLTLNESKQWLIGDLYNRGGVICDDESIQGVSFNEILEVTHYIEQKDLIKMISGV